MANLESLTIHGNRLTGAAVVGKMTSLNHLDVGGNRLGRSSNNRVEGEGGGGGLGSLLKLEQLTYLDFGGNGLTNSEVQRLGIFPGGVETVDTSNAVQRTVRGGGAAGLLTVLIAPGNDLSSIVRGSVQPLKSYFPGLTYVDVSNGSLPSLPHFNEGLRVLHAANNRITTLIPLTDLPTTLIAVDMSGNMIEQIKSNFADLDLPVGLTSLRMANNRIQYLWGAGADQKQKTTYRRPSVLRELDLSHNHLSVPDVASPVRAEGYDFAGAGRVMVSRTHLRTQHYESLKQLTSLNIAWNTNLSSLQMFKGLDPLLLTMIDISHLSINTTSHGLNVIDKLSKRTTMTDGKPWIIRGCESLAGGGRPADQQQWCQQRPPSSAFSSRRRDFLANSCKNCSTKASWLTPIIAGGEQCTASKPKPISKGKHTMYVVCQRMQSEYTSTRCPVSCGIYTCGDLTRSLLKALTLRICRARFLCHWRRLYSLLPARRSFFFVPYPTVSTIVHLFRQLQHVQWAYAVRIFKFTCQYHTPATEAVRMHIIFVRRCYDRALAGWVDQFSWTVRRPTRVVPLGVPVVYSYKQREAEMRNAGI